jgi:hypothetical protein
MTETFTEEKIPAEVKKTAIEEEQTFKELSKEDKLLVLSEKFSKLKEFQALSDGEKLNILIADRKERLKEVADIERQNAFFLAKDAAMREHTEYEKSEIETTRVRVYKERIFLEQIWNDATTTGDWKIPE